jgi:hypothetical protein
MAGREKNMRGEMQNFYVCPPDSFRINEEPMTIFLRVPHNYEEAVNS